MMTFIFIIKNFVALLFTTFKDMFYLWRDDKADFVIRAHRIRLPSGFILITIY